MVRKKLLLATSLALAAVTLLPIDPAFADPTCNELQLRQGGCVSGSINGGGVDLSGHKSSPGSGTSKPGRGGAAKPKPATPVCTGLPEACQTFTVIPPGAPGNPTLSIHDLKNFPVTPGTDHMEPNGWMIVGLDTNFYSVVGVEIVNGTLLGQPASVRFTPISWHWTYGDGRLATHTTPGTTWAAQGIPEFDPTPTSHSYTAEGTYFIDLSITFRAEYKYATGNWTPVVGTITLPANRLEATAGDAKTVLVNHDCTQNPTGPGC